MNTLVIGAGQAGLATSHELSRLGVDHVVLERGRVGQAWRERWDSFCLVTPNWSVQLPGDGGTYDGDDPDGFMPRDDIVRFMEAYGRRSGAPVREEVEVQSIAARDAGGFAVATSSGPIHAERVVLASGAYQRPHLPGATTIPTSVTQLAAIDYRNPASLPEGAVLVVGSGQTGAQIAEELHLAGRTVVLSCGRAPWSPRRIDGKDAFWWAVQTGFMDQKVEALPDPAERLVANLQNSGVGGGHTLNYRTLRELGVRLVGRFLGVQDGELHFADDLAASVAFGDERHARFAALVRHYAAEHGLPVPHMREPEPFDVEAPQRLPLAGITAVIHAGGFRPAYRDWLPWPDAFDPHGFPLHRDGESTVVPGLHFVGVHFLRTRKSSLLIGVGEDASVVARSIAAAAA